MLLRNHVRYVNLNPYLKISINLSLMYRITRTIWVWKGRLRTSPLHLRLAHRLPPRPRPPLPPPPRGPHQYPTHQEFFRPILPPHAAEAGRRRIRRAAVKTKAPQPQRIAIPKEVLVYDRSRE